MELTSLKKSGFDKKLPLEKQRENLLKAIELRAKLGLPAESDSGWVGEPPQKEDLLALQLKRVESKIAAGA